MRLSRSADYALRAMIYLAGLPEGKAANGSAIADGTSVHLPILLKVLRVLVQSRLIESRPGAGGGFQLTLPATQISMLRVVEAIEGPIEAGTCLLDDQPCHRKPWCGIHAVLIDIRQQVGKVMQGTSIERLRQDTEVRREFFESIQPQG
jgi:Rrf2 family transcriptional regulator, iron-sulfur cluster assembly transcription factor